MGDPSRPVRRLDGGQLTCPYCGWIELGDGRVTVYGVCPPDPFQRCRIEHALACPGQQLPDLWAWLTTLRQENARRAERESQKLPLQPGGEPLADAG
ncbi:hypothetical protein DMA15_33580 [Streptomyces sp. WAC 01529]|nr:DUF6083 domain-containing protein [Streptomyces sp. WAC 01529]AZM56899.1 hypothetical protein DMA15_33580 [Streptomyces sp. WAC 01529]